MNCPVYVCVRLVLVIHDDTLVRYKISSKLTLIGHGKD